VHRWTMTASPRYIEKILRARVYDVARETPLDRAPRLSRRLGNTVWIKREDLQPVFSFKLRGAYNRLVGLSQDQRARGVVAASAGNHAQGVAYSARKLGISATIVMPRTTPAIKVDAVEALGAEVALHGDTYDESSEHARQLVEQSGAVFVHPFDDSDVIAGQGTIGMEILRQHPAALHAIFVPVGGGGLIAGIAAYTKVVRPEVKVIGVEPLEAPTLHAALQARRRILLREVGIFVDGVAVRQIGKETFRVARQHVDQVVLVSTDAICAAIKDIFEDTRTIAEPAGALSLAGLKAYARQHGLEGENLVAIESGANMNFDRLRHVAERARLGQQAEALLAVTIPEQPGSFLRFCKALGRRSITEFNYRFADPAQAHVFVGVELSQGYAERDAIIDELRQAGYSVLDMTDNEMAKLHLRYMVGGQAPGLTDERLLRFEFPERPGALLDFLESTVGRWNISLFHYRNHGADYGRVLMGLQVPQPERRQLFASLAKLGYPFSEETDNQAYHLFAGTAARKRPDGSAPGE
jgi:threonine dehydratase